jgi:hypothetical protein
MSQTGDHPQHVPGRRRHSTAAFYIAELDVWASGTTCLAWLRWRLRRKSGAATATGPKRDP